MMRKIVVMCITLSAFISGHTQSMIRWWNIYGGPGVEVGYSVQSCPDQGYIVAGSSSTMGPTDGYIVRTDSLGLVMWSKFYGGNNIDVFRDLELLPDSGYIVAGYSNSGGSGGYDGWAVRIDKNGDTLWTRYIGTSDWDFFYGVTPTFDHGFVFAGGTYGSTVGDEDMWFVKLDSSGALVWQRTYGGSREDEARAVAERSDSLLIACGYTNSLGDTTGDSWILKINFVNGDTIWSRKALHSVGPDKALGIATDTINDRYGVVGQYTTSTGDQNAYIFISIMDSTTFFDITNGINGYEYFSDIVFLKTSYNLAAAGSTENDGGGNGDMFLFRDFPFWSSTNYGTPDHEEGYGIDATHDRGYIVCGMSDGFNSAQSNLFLVKTDTLGYSSQALWVRENPELRSSCMVYPNPASDQLSLTLDCIEPPSGELAVRVFDIAGRELLLSAPAAWTRLSDRSFTCELNTSALPDGSYTLVITDNGNNCANSRFIIAR